MEVRSTKVGEETDYDEDHFKLLQVRLNKREVEALWVKFEEKWTRKRKENGIQHWPSWFLHISCPVH